MAWTNPVTYIAGAILTAAQMNVMQANALAGGPIYATEAARDAAITAPFEGQRAYITGSTVVAGTGTVTAVPTGIQTIYNGTEWVCVTPVSANTAASGNTTSAGYTATLAGAPGTNPSVTVTTGTTALVVVSGYAYNPNLGQNAGISFAVSGATTRAAQGGEAFYTESNQISGSRLSIITGLTAGTNTFTLQYRTGAATAYFEQRAITVQGIA